jgi:hypothetical protein
LIKTLKTRGALPDDVNLKLLYPPSVVAQGPPLLKPSLLHLVIHFEGCIPA